MVAAVASASDASSTKDNLVVRAESQEYQQDLEKIISAEKSLNPCGTNNLAAYEKFADGIRAKWASKNRQYFAELTLRMVRPLSSGRFNERRQFTLARTYVLAAVGEPNKISLETEFELTETLMYMVHEPADEAFARLRRMDAEAILHLWKRLTDTIDPNWDPNDHAYLNVPLPPGVIGTSGMAPQMIEDPKQRAAYEEAIEKNRLKAETRHTQLMARRWLKSFSPPAKQYIVQMYSKPPYATEELTQLLMQLIPDEQVRTGILNAVWKNTEAPPDSDGDNSKNRAIKSTRGWSRI